LDEAIKSERKSQDGALRRERFRKRLVAEALLASERLQTDENLFDERDCADRAAARMSELLCDEQTAHTATRATLAYRDQALAMVSHDLKNPAIAITIAARLIRKRLSENDRNRAAVLKDLTIIEQSALSIDRMIDALLDIERIAHGKFLLHPHEGDLCLLLQESMDLFSPIASNKPCTLTANICPGPLWATFDHDRLLQVLSNLIGNAIKFTPPGGLITLSARQDDGRTVISVSDSGPGVSEEDQTRLFQKFSQLQQEEGGLGLGLYIAKSIVEAHGGHIGIDSVLGQGCTFTFDLPSGSAAPLGRQNAR
jgi:signal transduction histidine kinase